MSPYNIASTIFLVLSLSSLALDGILEIPTAWYISLLIVFIGALTYGSIILSASFFVKVRSSGLSNGIALTFDDGPLPGNTDKILDILKYHEVEATFFCIGNRIDASPGVVKRIDAEGHLVGNHSYWHGALFDLKSSPMVSKELYDTDLALFNAIGKRPRFFRPPYGVTNPMIAKAMRRANYTVIGWSIRSFDTIIKDPEKLFQRVTKTLRPGDIILLHDYCESTVSILPRLLDHIKGKGWNLMRVDNLLNEKGYV